MPLNKDKQVINRDRVISLFLSGVRKRFLYMIHISIVSTANLNVEYSLLNPVNK